MPTKSGAYVYLEDGSNAKQVYVANAPKLASTIQTHNAVSIALSGSSSSVWINCDGFSKIAVNLKNDGNTSSQVNLLWSVDGSTQIGFETVLASGSSQYRSAISDTKAQYVLVQVQNLDSALAHTMSAWAYMKS
jgi:hypothetical protein